MSKLNVNKNNKITVNNCKQTGWQGALADAESHLEIAQDEVAKWKATVRICRERVRTGAPWPEDKAETAAESVPA